LIGLASLPRIDSRIANLVIMNTGLSIGKEPVLEDFLKWLRYVDKTPDLSIGEAVRIGLVQAESIDAATVAAYDAPFPDRTCCLLDSPRRSLGSARFTTLAGIISDAGAAKRCTQQARVFQLFRVPNDSRIQCTDQQLVGTRRIPVSRTRPRVRRKKFGQFEAVHTAFSCAPHFFGRHRLEAELVARRGGQLCRDPISGRRTRRGSKSTIARAKHVCR
jgi:hypothetical protein